MRKFLISAAAIALAASAAHADPGKGQGGGKDNKGGGAQAAGPVKGGGDKAKGGGNGGQARADKSDKGHAMHAEKADKGGGGEKRAAKADKADRGPDARGKKDRSELARDSRGNGRDVRLDRDDDGRLVRFDRDRGLVAGCPPGLAKKNNDCMPPGLAKKRDDWRHATYRPDWFGLSSLNDGRYFYDDGYLYQLGQDNSVLGFIPLLGGALGIGNPWPSYYPSAPVPDYYERYYNLGSADSYRYADDVLYRVDPQTNAISGIAALLTGDRFAVGQQLPMGYDVYNVPYAYHDRFADGPDAHYRYADGYVYEVDPTTQLVQAVIELLV